MKIGIIGSGNVGTGIAKLLTSKGHEIMMSFARDRNKLEETAKACNAKAGSVAEAVDFAEVIILATPWNATQQAIKEVGSLTGKILWDCTNPLKTDMSGLAIGTDTSGGETVARWVSGAKVVKAIPPFAELLHAPSRLLNGRKPGVFVCGDDADARKTVYTLVEQLDADPVDAGPLSLARYTEPLGMLLVQLAYVQGFGAHIGAALLKGD